MTTYTDVFGSDAVPSTLTGYVEVTLSANTQFYWPEVNSETNLVADIMDVTASGAFNLIMPPANQASVGRNILINNVGSETFSIVDNDSNTIVTLTPGQIKSLYLIDNSDAAGLWRAFTFGAGTSSADAALLNGNGLAVLEGKLAQTAENRTTATSATLAANDRASSYVFSSSGSVMCNLLRAATAGNGYFVMLSNRGSGTLTLEPYSSETIDGALNKALAPGESCIAVCDGVNWVTIGHGRSTEFQFTKLVLDVTTGSPFTLSSAQAQNKLLQLIGSPSANVILNVPKVVSVYYIQGAFSGANYVQVQTTTGDYVRVYGTDRVIVYCDGEDVVLAQTTAIPATDLAGGVAGAIVYQSGVGDTAFTSAGTAGQVLTSQGTSAPTWSNLDFSSLAGTVPVNKGGTGITSLPTGGLLRGNGVSPVSIASATDIVAAIGSTPVQNANSATTAGRAKPQRADGVNWDLSWYDPGGQEFYVLGSSNGTTVRPCVTSGLNVSYAAIANYANSAGSATTATDSTKVAKTGDTMTGYLMIRNENPYLALSDVTSDNVMLVNYDADIVGFYKNVGAGTGWKMYVTDGGNIWTSAFGFLTDYFSAKVHTHNYAGINSNFDWELVRNATIASNATLNVLSNYGYGIYYYTTSGSTGMFITCGNGDTFIMGTGGTVDTVNASDILSNSGSDGRTLYLYKLRKTA